MSNHHLKPCPFCGNSQYVYCSTVPHHNDYSTYRVVCAECHVVLAGISEEDAVQKWNARVEIHTQEKKEDN